MIEAFPNNINRDSFGWYIAGFTDGEGCFALLVDSRAARPGRKNKQEQPTPCASFALNLRQDDDRILKLIQSYFHGGTLVYGKTRNMCSLRFRKLDDLALIVGHFDKFTLLAKKKDDFRIWREGIGLMLFVAEREQRRSQRYGSSYKWTPSDYAWFVSLKEQLSEGRKFKAVSNEESCLCNTTQPQFLLDPDVCGIAAEESAKG